MRVGVLTSSRADYGVYLPLLKAIEADSFFELKIIAFGTHVSKQHGYTIDQIKQDGFKVEVQLGNLISGDSEKAISSIIGNTILKFSSVWKILKDKIDLVFALGDRYEMFAAVSASVPFNIPIAHIHGGETTLGAIDNKFRHAITLMSKYHFTSTVNYAKKVSALIGTKNNINNVGALSLDNLLDLELLDKEAFKERWNINLDIPTILTTFHPETISLEKNKVYAIELVKTLKVLTSNYQIVITMPNADTMGTVIRKKLEQIVEQNPKVISVENFGTLGYFSCIKHSSFLLGNTSSGIIEAASFGKYVINLGDRQKGRAQSNNIYNEKIQKRNILEAVQRIEKNNYNFTGKNIYADDAKTSLQIIDAIKKIKHLPNK